MEYDKNRALFWDKCNQSWVLWPRRRAGECSSSRPGHCVRWWCRCSRQGTPAGVCRRRCQGRRALGCPFGKVSTCHATARHHPRAMAGGSVPSPSPFAGLWPPLRGSPGDRQAALPTPACSRHGKLGGMGPEPEPRWPGGCGGDNDDHGSSTSSLAGTAQHGRAGDKRGDAHLPRPRGSWWP